MKHLFLAAAYLLAGFYLYYLPSTLGLVVLTIIVVLTALVSAYQMFLELREYQDLEY